MLQNSDTTPPGFIAGYLEQHPEHERIMRSILSSSEAGTTAIEAWKNTRRRAA